MGLVITDRASKEGREPREDSTFLDIPVHISENVPTGYIFFVSEEDIQALKIEEDDEC